MEKSVLCARSSIYKYLFMLHTTVQFLRTQFISLYLFRGFILAHFIFLQYLLLGVTVPKAIWDVRMERKSKWARRRAKMRELHMNCPRQICTKEIFVITVHMICYHNKRDGGSLHWIMLIKLVKWWRYESAIPDSNQGFWTKLKSPRLKTGVFAELKNPRLKTGVLD